MRTNFGILVSYLLLVVFTGSAFAAHEITAWPDNKKGALSLTFDDGCPSHASQGGPALDAREVKGTFFVTTDWVGGWSPGWNFWNSAAGNGHEIASHSMTHPRLTSLSSNEVEEEVSGSKSVIDAQIPNQQCISFAYPYGDLDSSVASIAQNIYIASRGITCELNSEPFDWANVRACSPDSGDDIFLWTDAAEQQGSWLVVYIHTLIGGSDGCWGSWENDEFTTYLDYLLSKDLWVGTFGDAVKYIRERSSATLSVLSSSNDQIVLDLTDTMEDAVYDQPLTIRSEVPSSWVTATVQQGVSTIEVSSTVEGNATVIYYNAVPDSGYITLSNPQAENPQITALVPGSVTAGSPGFALRVTGTNFVPESVVRWNGLERATSFISITELQATIPAADIATPGTIPVTVFNPNGSLSDEMVFEVNAPQPTVVGLSPSWGIAGGPSFTMTVDGTNFVSGTIVQWNGSDRVSSVVSSTEVNATILAADIATAGTASVTVNNPPPGGGTSNAIDFDIYPTLVSLSLSPSSVVGGSASTGTVTLSGPAPSGDAVVSLSSSNPSVAAVPGNVTVAGGSVSATFPVTTVAVSSPTAVTISALYGGVTQSASLTVTPQAAPVADFTGTPTSGTEPLSVTFTDTSNGIVSSWLWDFGDTTTSTEQNPFHVYNAAGTYTVSLTVTGPGGTDSETKTAYITVSETPTLVSLSLSPSSVVGGGTSTGTVTLSGPAPSGDAVVSLSSSNPSVAAVPGNVTVAGGSVSATFPVTTVAVSSPTAVTISALYGGVTQSAVITVQNLPVNQPPVADAGPDRTVTDVDGDGSEHVVLDGSGSTDADGTIVSYVWKEGGVTVASGVSPAVLLDVGVHTLTLEVTDDGGRTGTDTVVITVAGVGGGTVDVRVATGSDDAEESPSGSMYLTSSDLELVYDDYNGGGNQTVGIRFTGVDIPAGASILRASVQFQVDETDSEATSLVIRGEDADHAGPFLTSSRDISSRPVTAAAVPWIPPAWPVVGEAGPSQQTPDIASVIQEIVDRPGWSSGNSLVILVTGTGRRVAESYEGNSGGAPLLQVDYAN